MATNDEIIEKYVEGLAVIMPEKWATKEFLEVMRINFREVFLNIANEARQDERTKIVK